MNFSGKMWLMIILKITQKQGFTLSVESTFLEKPQGGQIDPPPPSLSRSLSYINISEPYSYIPYIPLNVFVVDSGLEFVS